MVKKIKLSDNKSYRWSCGQPNCLHSSFRLAKKCLLRRQKRKIFERHSSRLRSRRKNQIHQHKPIYHLQRVSLPTNLDKLIQKKQRFRSSQSFMSDLKKVSIYRDLQDCFLFDDGKKIKQNLVQGHIGDCALIAVICGIIDFDASILQKRFLTDLNPSEYVCIKLFFNGKERLVEMNDTIPITDDSHSLTSSTATSAAWLYLLEKAIAKLYGGYEQLTNGNCDEFLTMLTGFPCDVMKTNVQDFGDVIKLLFQEKCIVIIGTKQKTIELQEKHAYAVIRFKDDNVGILNPWGQFSNKQQIQWIKLSQLAKDVNLVYSVHTRHTKKRCFEIKKKKHSLFIEETQIYTLCCFPTKYFANKANRNLNVSFWIGGLIDKSEEISFFQGLLHKGKYIINFQNYENTFFMISC